MHTTTQATDFFYMFSPFLFFKKELSPVVARIVATIGRSELHMQKSAKTSPARSSHYLLFITYYYYLTKNTCVVEPATAPSCAG